MTFVSICVDFHGLRFQGKRVGGVGVLSDRVLRDAFVSICVDFKLWFRGIVGSGIL
jgi:hypothetical protein